MDATRRTRVRAAAIACVLALGAVPGQALGASPEQTLRARLSASQSRAGGAAGAYVYDTTARRALYASRATTPRIPASVEKLYTTSAALLAFGPQGTFSTQLLATALPAPDGTLDGDLWLHGNGDPTFGRDAAQELARALADSGVTRVTGRLRGDEHAFDDRRGVPSSGYRPSSDLGAPLTALPFDRVSSSDPAALAAARTRRILVRGGVEIAHSATGAAPEGAQVLAEISSPPLADLIRATNQPSDNWLAEMLLKAIAAPKGTASTSRGARAVRAALRAKFGIGPKIVDGSGLSRHDRTTPRDVVTLLTGMVAEDPAGPALKRSLPVSARSGTLRTRMRGTSAAGRCQAKTGTLSDVSSLAGYCRSKSGHLLAFAFLMNGVNVSTARSLQDRMALALVRYDG